MIEVHVFNAFLLPELKQTSWFNILTFINGLVAPAFLFVSGFAFAVSSGSKLDDMRKFKYPFWKKLWRYVSIILIAYVLHLPYESLSKILNNATPEQIQQIFVVDVLQCIGAGLLVLFALRLIIQSNKIYNYSLIALTIMVMVVSPILWKNDLTNYMPLIVANYFNKLNGSLFPVFPWINFILAGAIFAKYFIQSVHAMKEEKFMRLITYIGLAMIRIGSFILLGIISREHCFCIPQSYFFY